MTRPSVEKDFEDMLFRTIPSDDTWAIPGMIKEFRERISQVIIYHYQEPNGAKKVFEFKINPLENGVQHGR